MLAVCVETEKECTVNIAAGRTIYWNVTAARRALAKLQSAIQEAESMRGIAPPFGFRAEREEKEEKPQPTQDILTKREVAEFLRVSPRTVDLWREVHGMPCNKMGGYRALQSSGSGKMVSGFQRIVKKFNYPMETIHGSLRKEIFTKIQNLHLRNLDKIYLPFIMNKLW